MDYITEEEKLRLKQHEEISAHQELLLVKKAQILTILRDLEPAEARHIFSEIRRKYENDEIQDKFFVKE